MTQPRKLLDKKGHIFPLLVLLCLTSCGSNNPEQDGGLRLNQNLQVADKTRNYHLYLPTNPASAPIVVLLHGNSGSANQLLGIGVNKSPFKLWLDIARRESVILVIPDGVTGPNNQQGWNDCRNDAPTNPDSDDESFVNDLIDQVKNTYGTLSSNVFVAGISNGALMGMRIADEMPEKLKALAIVVASRPVNSECQDSAVPLPVLVMNGTSDPILPYDGGQIKSNRGEIQSTAETVSYWINRNQTDAVPVETVISDIDQNDNSTVTQYSYRNGNNNTVVEHYEVTNGGHTEPSIAERYGNIYKLVVGNQNGDIEMANEIWEFFSAQ